MTSFTHSHAESGFGDAIFVGVIEGRVGFTFEPQELLEEERVEVLVVKSTGKSCGIEIPRMTIEVKSPGRRWFQHSV